MNERGNEFWVERYRPKKVEDIILPKNLKSTFLKIVEQGSIPNLILAGSSGLGKTTVARALCEELGCDYIFINGSDERNIDVLRNKIRNFASTVSLSGGAKVVILDESDYLNATSTQPALRGFIEEFHKTCRFIFTCNHKKKIIEPLHSRCTVIDFSFGDRDLPGLCVQFHERLVKILGENSVEADDQALIKLIRKHAPDWRRVLNEAQTLAMNGVISEERIETIDAENFEVLIEAMKKKHYNSVVKWAVENSNLGATAIFRKLYDRMNKYLEPKSTPALVLILAEYDYKQAFVTDPEINLVAALTEIMSTVEFK